MFRSLVARLAAVILFGCSFIPGGSAVAGPATPVKTIVVFGDSQAQGVAGALQRMFVRDRSYHVIDKTVPGTGLSQKQQFDWVDTIDHWLASEHADVAIVMFGGNDRLAVRLAAGGRAIAYKTDAWKQMYSERLNSVLNLFATAKVPIVWLGQPVARDEAYTADMTFLNQIYESVVPAAGNDYIPLWTIIADDDGNYAAYGKALDGETKRLRQDDGIHFTPAGYDIIAVKIRTEIDALLAKPSVTGSTEAASTAPTAAPAVPSAPTSAATPAETATAPVNPAPAVADSSAHS